MSSEETFLAFSKKLAKVCRQFPQVTPGEAAGIFIGFAVGALLQAGHRRDEVAGRIMVHVHVALEEAQKGSLVKQ